MTKPMPLNASPLWLVSHRFTEVFLKASGDEKPPGQFALETTRSLRAHSEDPHKFLLILTIRLGSNAPDKEVPYTATLTIEGEFEVAAAYPASKREELVNVTGASMLYGACREMLANLTARSSHGMSTLPSVSFAASALKRASSRVTTKVAKVKT
jgi:preprotein translocase subunit SecB